MPNYDEDYGEAKQAEKRGCLRILLGDTQKALLEQEERFAALDQALRPVSRSEAEEKAISTPTDSFAGPEVCEELRLVIRRITKHTSLLNGMLDRLEI